MSFELGQSEVHTLFEKSTVVRPAITEVAKMALAGATENDIVYLAEKNGIADPYKADLQHMLADTDTLLPYADELVGSLAADFPDRRIVFAARDGEMMADLFAMRRPSHPAALLPASMTLWASNTLAVTSLAVPFFTSHGLAKQTVESKEAVLFDTGFMGSVGGRVWQMMAMHYGGNGSSIMGVVKSPGYYRRRLPLRMVLADTSSKVAETQLGFGLSNERWGTKHFPFSYPAIATRPARILRNFEVAVAMQMQPRYHESYVRLERRPDTDVVQAIPKVTSALSYNKTHYNSSIASPIGAACVQLRVARYALGLSATPVAEINTLPNSDMSPYSSAILKLS